jgi:1-acyl-sn-glycerol-3-phosphate acyltransferase
MALGSPTMAAVLNIIRVLLTVAWTVVVGTPLLVVIYARYGYAFVRAMLGRPDILDHTLEANARLAGWVAQRLWTTVILAVAGVRLHVREITTIDWSKAHVVCANHASVFDAVAMIRAIPPPYRFVAKREILKWPIVGWLLWPAGQIIVDRANRTQAVHSLGEAGQRHIRGQVIFFVEGTRTLTGELLPFKKGAFHFAIDNQLPILPAAVCGTYATLAKRPWWQLNAGHQIEVVFCSPIQPPAAPQQGERAQIEELLNATHTQIAEALADTED